MLVCVHFQVALEDLEKRIGVHIHPNLDRAATENLCRVDGCKLVSTEKLELIILDKKLKSSKSIEQLEKHWRQFQQKAIEPDEENLKTYIDRKTELEGLEKHTAKSATAG